MDNMDPPRKKNRTQSDILQFFDRSVKTVNSSDSIETASLTNAVSSTSTDPVNSPLSVPENQMSECHCSPPEPDNANGILTPDPPLETGPNPTDVGFAIQKALEGHKLTDAELTQSLNNRWVPATKDDLSYSVEKGTKRYLGYHYLTTYPWLAVSRVEGLQGAWCVWCALFHSSKTAGGPSYSGGQALGALVQTPLKRFHKLTYLSAHSDTKYHKMCQERVLEFQNRSASGSQNDVRNRLDTARLCAIQNNRNALKPIVDTILLCARQNIPIRGHRDSGRITSAENTDVNEGNFRALLRYRVRGGDEVLSKHLFHGAGNAQYISPEIQNDLISAAMHCAVIWIIIIIIIIQHV